MTLPAEFALIAQHFRPLAGEGALGLADDAAVLTPPAGRQLVLTADTLVEGVHFLPDDPPETLGRKLLRVNLSDLAAMGAVPLGALLCVSVPVSTPPAWFEAFSAGLALDLSAFGLALLGGDTTSTPGPVSLSATLLGHVAPGGAWLRSGAKAGDELWVTGTIGDGLFGLRACRDGLSDPSGDLVRRYRLPDPRLGLALSGIVSAAMDVSDGLVQDAGHLARASGLSVRIERGAVPVSAAVRAAWAGREPDLLEACLSGGDDYELLMSAPETKGAALVAACARAQLPVTRIGCFLAGEPDVIVMDGEGAAVASRRGGWSHF